MVQHPKTAKTAKPPEGQISALQELSFADVDEQAAALRGWNQSYLQLSGGGFRGVMQHLDLGGARLFTEGLSNAVYQTGTLEAGVLAIGVPFHCEGVSLFCGQPCDRDSLHVFSGCSGFEFCTGTEHVMMGIELDAELAASLVPEEGCGFGTQAGIRASQTEVLDGLRKFMVTLFDSARASPALFTIHAVKQGMVESLLEQIGALQDAPAPNRNSSHDAHWRLVHRAQDIIRERRHQPPSVAELCALLQVSRGTLQNHFQRVLGLSPLAYLRAFRLGAVRQQLKASVSVTEAATDFGFWHFGHFARDYQAMFGELPSQTHKRHVARAGH